jgi:hypothetical protein
LQNVIGNQPARHSVSKTDMKYFTTLTFLILTATVHGQTNNGAVKIFVQKKSTKEPVIDSLFISLSNTVTTNYRVMPDSDGETIIKLLEPGKYDVSVSAKGYQTQIITNVIIGYAKTAYLVYGMTTIDEAKTKKRRRNKT